MEVFQLEILQQSICTGREGSQQEDFQLTENNFGLGIALWLDQKNKEYNLISQRIVKELETSQSAKLFLLNVPASSF